MFTLITCPKPFRGEFDHIQRNAIESWLRLGDQVEVVLVGDEPGVAGVVDEYSRVRWVESVDRNERDVPLVSSVFKRGWQAARHDIVGYVNCDIILLGEFADAVDQARRKTDIGDFLLVGRRVELDIQGSLDFSGGWEKRLRSRIRRNARRQFAGAIDYFVFNDMLWEEIPPFAIGRFAWDHWLVSSALEQAGTAVVDLSPGVTVVHQSHGSMGSDDEVASDDRWERAFDNAEIGGRHKTVTTVWDTNYVLKSGGIKKVGPVRRLVGFLYRIRGHLRRLGREAGAERPHPVTKTLDGLASRVVASFRGMFR